MDTDTKLPDTNTRKVYPCTALYKITETFRSVPERNINQNITDMIF